MQQSDSVFCWWWRASPKTFYRAYGSADISVQLPSSKAMLICKRKGRECPYDKLMSLPKSHMLTSSFTHKSYPAKHKRKHTTLLIFSYLISWMKPFKYAHILWVFYKSAGKYLISSASLWRTKQRTKPFQFQQTWSCENILHWILISVKMWKAHTWTNSTDHITHTHMSIGQISRAHWQ